MPRQRCTSSNFGAPGSQASSRPSPYRSRTSTRSHCNHSRQTGSQYSGKTSCGERIFNRSTGKSPLSDRYCCVGKFEIKGLPLQWNQILRRNKERRIHVRT